MQCLWIASEEVLADKLAGFGLVGLVVAIWSAVHEVHQSALTVLCQQVVPLASPDHLDNVPARAAEEGFKFLDDLAVTANRSVKTLQVCVHNKGQIV